MKLVSFHFDDTNIIGLMLYYIYFYTLKSYQWWNLTLLSQILHFSSNLRHLFLFHITLYLYDCLKALLSYIKGQYHRNS